MKPIRVMLVDDQALFRDGLRALLTDEAKVAVVAEAANGREALQRLHGLEVDVVLMDLRMPEMDGVEATRRINERYPSLPVVVLTTFDNDDLVFQALRAHAKGYLLKDAPLRDIVNAIIAAHQGQSVLAPTVTRKVLEEFSRVAPPPPPADTGLTTRELEVLCLLGRGASNKQIGAALNLAEGTVKNHLSHIFTKLEVNDRTSAALKARELGLV